jgi:hypothetical protein
VVVAFGVFMWRKILLLLCASFMRWKKRWGRKSDAGRLDLEEVIRRSRWKGSCAEGWRTTTLQLLLFSLREESEGKERRKKNRRVERVSS